MTPTEFVTRLAALRFADTFNPYADHCATYDLAGAAQQRSKLLTRILERAMKVEIDSIWVGRDLGFRGGRRTGLALTDDVHFGDHLSRWEVSGARPTVGSAVPERTARVIWDILSQIDQPVFLWNVFPLHPHKSGAPFTNRAHNAMERRAGSEVLREVIRLLRPKRLVAVGHDAATALDSMPGDMTLVRVRHPSYGGQVEFTRQIRATYGISEGTLL